MQKCEYRTCNVTPTSLKSYIIANYPLLKKEVNFVTDILCLLLLHSILPAHPPNCFDSNNRVLVLTKSLSLKLKIRGLVYLAAQSQTNSRTKERESYTA